MWVLSLLRNLMLQLWVIMGKREVWVRFGSVVPKTEQWINDSLSRLGTTDVNRTQM